MIQKIILVGNCQVHGLAQLMRAMAPQIEAIEYECTSGFLQSLTDQTFDINLFIYADIIFAHQRNDWIKIIEAKIPNIRDKIKYIPSIVFSAFHPDCVYVNDNSMEFISSPIGAYHSSLAFYGWKNGLGIEKTLALFCHEVFEAIGFFDYWDTSVESLTEEWESCGFLIDKKISRWSAQGSWMHTVNHPKLLVLADVARAALSREKLDVIPYVEEYVPDNLARHPCWPIYPQIGKELSLIDISAPYFKKGEHLCPAHQPVSMLTLEEFIVQSFEIFNQYKITDLHCERMNSVSYLALSSFVNKSSKTIINSSLPNEKSAGKNPYKSLPDHQFWRRALEQMPAHEVDPIISTKFKINKTDKVATAGSCFAQHISRTLKSNGFNYYVAESGEADNIEENERRNFGVFSARFGNLYSPRQLIQLFDRAYGFYHPLDKFWARPDGKFVDPFRPQVEPDGFHSLDQLEMDRQSHFAAVREMFESLDIFVFTLGLTEAWRHRVDGAVFPIAPGVVAGVMDPSIYEFINFKYNEILLDMQTFVEKLKRVNPLSRILLTVSPVPLIATYEDRHVLVSTTYSKSTLRAAASDVCADKTFCEYFPSYEIITGNYNKGAYFETDLRSIRQEGVNHVMRLFMLHYSAANKNTPVVSRIKVSSNDMKRENSAVGKIICDEESLDS